MGAPKILGLSPIVMVSNIERSLAFYTDVLEFEQLIWNETSRYALLRWEGAMLALIENTSEEARIATSEHTAAQIWVEEIDTLWERLGPKLAALPEGRVKPPHDRDYGVREIHLKDPDGFLMFITQDHT